MYRAKAENFLPVWPNDNIVAQVKRKRWIVFIYPAIVNVSMKLMGNIDDSVIGPTKNEVSEADNTCLLYTSPSPRDS